MSILTGRLARVYHTIFANNSTTGPVGTGEISEFGSTAAGAPTTTTSLSAIQTLSQWADGWFSAVLAQDSPVLEDQNAFDFYHSAQMAYLFQAGIAEWDSQTTYYKGSFVSSNGIVYISVTDSNLNNSISDTSNWMQLPNGIFPLVETLAQQAQSTRVIPSSSIQDYISEPFLFLDTGRVVLTNTAINTALKQLSLTGSNLTGTIEAETYLQSVKGGTPLEWSVGYTTPTRLDVASSTNSTTTVLTSATDRHLEIYNGTTSFGWFVHMKKSSTSYEFTQASPGYRVSITNATGATNITLTHSALPIALTAATSTDKWVFIAENANPVQQSISGAGFTSMTPNRIRLVDSVGIPYSSYVHANYKLDETSGNALNSAPSGSTYDAPQVGTVPSATGIIAGARGPFTTSNYFRWNAGASSATPFDSATFMFECWLKTSSAGNNTIANKFDGTTNGFQFALGPVSAGKITTSIGNGAGLNVFNSTATYNDGSWHHFFFAILNNSGADTDAVRAYIDGVRDTAYNSAGIGRLGSTHDFFIGIDYAVANPFNGLLDEVTYYSTTPVAGDWTTVENIVAERYNGGFGAPYGNTTPIAMLYGILPNQSASMGDRLGFKPGIRREVTTIIPVINNYSAKL